MNVNVLGDLGGKCGNYEGLSPKYVTDYGVIAGIGQLRTFPKFGNGKIA